MHYIDKMNTELSNSEIDSNDVDRERLESQITGTYSDLEASHVFYTSHLLRLVKEMQKYVTENYVSVDNFLSTTGTLVSPTFADISKEVGYSIKSSNINNIS